MWSGQQDCNSLVFDVWDGGGSSWCARACVCPEISTYISEVQCSSACGGEAGGGGHLALADRPAFHTDTNATWDTHFSSHCGEGEGGRDGGKGGRERSAVRHHCKAATVHGDTDAGSSLIELCGLSPEADGAEGDIVTFQLETDSHLEHQVR